MNFPRRITQDEINRAINAFSRMSDALLERNISELLNNIRTLHGAQVKIIALGEHRKIRYMLAVLIQVRESRGIGTVSV